jgi:hypothetical protein
VAGSCEHGNEPVGCINASNILTVKLLCSMDLQAYCKQIKLRRLLSRCLPLELWVSLVHSYVGPQGNSV